MLSLLVTNLFAFHVMLDPGHGGVDSGASYYGIKESKITMNIAKDLEKMLKNHKEIKTFLTRDHDKTTDLEKRTKKAHQNEARLFLSIHTNSSPSKRARGIEIFFENQLPPDQEALFLAYREEQLELGEKTRGRPSKFKENYTNDLSAILDDLSKSEYQRYSHLFAKEIQKVWQEKEGVKVRLKQAPFHVISTTNMPSVLVEIGFLSNPQEAKKLKKRSYQKKVAQILYKAILDWKEKWTFKRSKI